MTPENNALNTPCRRIAEGLHGLCCALEAARNEVKPDKTLTGQLTALETDGRPWMNEVGKHVALAIAAVPESVWRAWLQNPRVVGGEEIYKTLRAGCTVRATTQEAVDKSAA
jgi:hypothetical protein